VRFSPSTWHRGQYTLSLDDGVPLIIEAHAGEQGFVRLDWSYGIDRVPIPKLSKVGETEARREMKFLSYISAKKMHSNPVPKTDPTESFQPQLRTRDHL
jgi:hypothetical protein